MDTYMPAVPIGDVMRAGGVGANVGKQLIKVAD
jgi:hypothetical protein